MGQFERDRVVCETGREDDLERERERVGTRSRAALFTNALDTLSKSERERDWKRRERERERERETEMLCQGMETFRIIAGQTLRARDLGRALPRPVLPAFA